MKKVSYKIIQSKTQVFIILSLLLLAVDILCINKNMPEVQILQQKKQIQLIKSTNGNKFSIDFNQVDYQISGTILKRTTNLKNQQQTYKLSSYEHADQCRFIGSDLIKQQIGVLNLDFVVTQYYVSKINKKIYVLGDQNLIHVYSYDEKGFVPSESIQFTKFSSSSVVLGHFMQSGDNLLFTAKDKLYKLPQKPQENIQLIGDMSKNLYPNNQQLYVYKIKPTQNKNQFILISQLKAIVAKFTSDSIQMIKSYEPQQGKIFMDGTYNLKHNTLYLLQQNTLIIQKQNSRNIVNLQGNSCSRIKLIGTSLFVVCSDNKVSFVAQFLVNNIAQNPDLILNRYYAHVQGVADVYSAGHDKIILTSGDQLNFMGLSIHRTILKQINKRQPTQSFLIQPFIGVAHVQQCDKDGNSALIIVTVNKIELVLIKSTHPKIECNFLDNHPQILTAVFNTSHCTDAYLMSHQDKGNTQNLRAICTQWYPYAVLVIQSQMDTKVIILIVAVVIVLAIGLSLFCAGFGFKRIQLTRIAIMELEKKIKKLKERRKHTKPI